MSTVIHTDLADVERRVLAYMGAETWRVNREPDETFRKRRFFRPFLRRATVLQATLELVATARTGDPHTAALAAKIMDGRAWTAFLRRRFQWLEPSTWFLTGSRVALELRNQQKVFAHAALYGATPETLARVMQASKPPEG